MESMSAQQERVFSFRVLHTEATVRRESFILPVRAGVESNTQASISRTWALITNGATKLCIWSQ